MTARIDAIGLVTSDVDATMRFYRALGCRPDEMRTDRGDRSLVEHTDVDLGACTRTPQDRSVLNQR